MPEIISAGFNDQEMAGRAAEALYTLGYDQVNLSHTTAAAIVSVATTPGRAREVRRVLREFGGSPAG